MLIFSNGTAYFDQGTNGVEIDENGMPIIGNDFSLSAPCFIESSNESKGRKNDEGYYPTGSYVISLDYDAVNENFNPSKVRLEHKHKGNLGVFAVQRIEHYDITRTIQIWT